MLQDSLSDLALVIAVLLVILLFDILPGALRRRRAGGPLLAWSDVAQRKYVLVLLPLAILVVLQQNIFSALGFGTRDNVPYVLGFFLLLAMAAVLLVWWQKKKD